MCLFWGCLWVWIGDDVFVCTRWFEGTQIDAVYAAAGSIVEFWEWRRDFVVNQRIELGRNEHRP